MSTARTPQPPVAEDPFFYGFRYAKRILPNGKVDYEEVPLTEEDVLHPREGDYITTTDSHEIDRNYLRNVLTSLTAGTPGAVVLSDCLIHWRVGRIRAMGPDLAVIFGVRERRDWSMFDAAAEGTAPELVIEITFVSTRNVDLNRKVDRYDRVGVPFYVIVDREWSRGRVSRMTVLGYRRGRQGFVRMRPNRQRRLWLQPVGCWLGVEQGQVVCYDAQGVRIGDYTDQYRAREAAEQRAAAAEEELRQLKEELRRRGPS